jgi:hypothetical protein
VPAASKHSLYLAYGQRIACVWPLDLPRASSGRPDVSITEARADRFLAGRKAAAVDTREDWFHHAVLADGSTYLHWTDLFEFLVSPDGRRILGHALKHASEESFKTYLLGHVLSFSLLRRGVEQLHSTTVVIDGSAVAFLGDSGYGKSSLGGAFLAQGHAVLTDDLLVLEKNGRGFHAHPGPPRIKMYPAMARRVLRSHPRGEAMNHATRKLIIPLLQAQLSGKKVPLRAIYVLNPPATSLGSKRISIRRMTDRRAFLELLRNTFNSIDLEPQRLKAQFNFARDVCHVVPVRALSYPRVTRMIPKLTAAILADLERRH